MNSKYILTVIGALAMTGAYLNGVGGIEPHFAGDNGEYIELVAQGGLCGGFKLTPKDGAGTIALRAMRVNYGAFNIGQPKEDETREDRAYNILPFNGQRFRYDWAGPGSKSHYKIYCFKQTGTLERTEWQKVRCQAVVDIDASSIHHNVGCVGGPAGPDADYPPLWMDKG